MNCNEFLSQTFLFSNIGENELNEIIMRYPPALVSYRRGEMIYSSEIKEPKVGFIVSGKCDVRKASDEKCVVINILEKYSSFGILSVLSAEEFPTQIFASKNSEVLYFRAGQIKEIVNNYSQISANIISFLVERIHFLNTKIATFSGTRVENRLASFLVFESRKRKSLDFSFNCLKASEEINAGRASVYRALASLEKNRLINFVDNKIFINDLQGLERISK